MLGASARRERRKVEEEEAWWERVQLLPEVSGSIGRANGEAQMTQNGPPDELIVVCSRLFAQTARALISREREAFRLKQARCIQPVFETNGEKDELLEAGGEM